jgi:hypothetical protein
MYFLGGLNEQRNQWTQFCTQWHNNQSTVRHREDMFEMTFPAGGRDTLFKNLSQLRYDEPFFYGNVDDLIWLVMFDRTAGIRLTHSPSGGGVNAASQTTNPAWDFQFLVGASESGEGLQLPRAYRLAPTLLARGTVSGVPKVEGNEMMPASQSPVLIDLGELPGDSTSRQNGEKLKPVRRSATHRLPPSTGNFSSV